MSELINNIKLYIDEKFSGELILAELLYDFPVFTVKHHQVFEIIKSLKEDPQFNFHFLTDLTGIQSEDEKQLGVIYHLHNMINGTRIRIKTYFDITNPEVKSLTPLWPSANWMERESYDFFGIRFLGHPNLKRILNVDEMDYFPLRKEFPLEDQTREDKDDKMFGR